jgi:hypothetical protein
MKEDSWSRLLGSGLFMNRRKWRLILCSIVLFSGFFWYFIASECLVVESNNGIILRLPAKAGEQLSLTYTHSVQKTQVIENIVIQANGSLVVDSTEYESFGVGLPFLASEGHFRQEGNRFILENIGRSLDMINLRAGPEAQLKLSFHDQTYALFQMVPNGTLIRLRVAPYYSTWLN